MKKMFIALLFGMIMFVLVACGQTKKTEQEKTPSLGEVLVNSVEDPQETKQLQSLYRKAIDEIKADGGELTVWAGGDEPNQQKALEDAFKKRFPEVPINIKVDLSKYHDLKINEQLKEDNLEPDVTMLQTSQDFDDWKNRGELLSYKPIGFNQQKEGYADAEGNYITAFILSFLPETAKGTKKITSYVDFLKPEFKDKLVLTYPHDDDAVLYVYDKIIQKHGEEFLQQLADQNPTFLRGTAAPAALVGKENFLGNLTGYMQEEDSQAAATIPESDPFITWTQRAATFKKSKHPAAAKLFLSYVSSKEYQSATQIWPTRKDLKAVAPYKELADYPNTSFSDFNKWMQDRAHIQELSNKMVDIFGPVKGDSPLKDEDLLKRIE